jgi:hypothetical protein
MIIIRQIVCPFEMSPTYKKRHVRQHHKNKFRLSKNDELYSVNHLQEKKFFLTIKMVYKSLFFSLLCFCNFKKQMYHHNVPDVKTLKSGVA